MNEIDSISIINRKNLDECDYFKTLLEEGYNKQLISDKDIINLQMQLLKLLDEKVYRHSGIDSGSIRTEIMEEILKSNIYTIGLYLKTVKNPDEAIKKLKEQELNILYQKGRKKIDRILDIIRVMYIKVKQNKINIQNYTYDDTICWWNTRIFKNI